MQYRRREAVGAAAALLVTLSTCATASGFRRRAAALYTRYPLRVRARDRS
jgi:hypothetical protein